MEKVKRTVQAERPHGQSLRDEKGSGVFEVRAWDGYSVIRDKPGCEVRWWGALNARLRS